MGYNDPAHLPQPLPEAEPLRFDIWDDQLMRECIGGRLTKPVQDLLITYSQMNADSDPELFFISLRRQLSELRAAVREEFNDL